MQDSNLLLVVKLNNSMVKPEEYTTANSNIKISNSKLAIVIVHHYLEGTGPEYNNEPVILADDELMEGKEKHEYITAPKLDIDGYELIKNTEGEYIIPNNASGIFETEPQEVYYYYNVKPLELIVHHYLNGTEDKLIDDEEYFYHENDHYKTNPSEELLEAYELVYVDGDEEKDITQNEVVSYYYKKKNVKITTRVEIPEDEAKNGRTEKGGSILGEDEQPYETVGYGDNSVKDIISASQMNWRYSTD